eukprot:374524-Hanusia_phi.AAC.1
MYDAQASSGDVVPITPDIFKCLKSREQLGDNMCVRKESFSDMCLSLINRDNLASALFVREESALSLRCRTGRIDRQDL